MKYFLLLVSLLFPYSIYAQSQCEPERVLSTTSATGNLNDYYIEEVQEVPSTVTFIVKGKRLNLVADPEDIENNFKNKKGRNFQISYEKVYGWLGDGCNEYQRLIRAKQIK